MGIKNELDALRVRMIADVQHEINIIAEVATVFGEIDDVRQRGYQRLSNVFSGQIAPPIPPQPLRSEEPPVGAAINGDRRAFLASIYGPENVDDILAAEGPPFDPPRYADPNDRNNAHHLAQRFAPRRGGANG
jgi:hypothetical protein